MLHGKPFTDAVAVNGALVISRQDGAIFRNGIQWVSVPVKSDDEAGLNSLASDGRHLWAGYVSQQGTITLADITSGKPIVLAEFGEAAPRHNAAGLLYANGKLLFGIGDNENPLSAQSDALPNGKVWVIDPFTGDKSIAAKGLRNPWGIDLIGNRIYISDVGESKFEEANIFASGGNYGWPCLEAYEPRIYAPETCNSLVSILPELAYGHNQGRGIVGVASYKGKLVYGDFSGEIATFAGESVKRFDGFLSKLAPIGSGVIALSFNNGVSQALLYR